MLTKTQLRALRWMDENPSVQAEWLANGKPIRRQPPEKWNQFKISGPTGSIIVDAEDMMAIRGFVNSCTAPDKMYAPNEAGLAALEDK